MERTRAEIQALIESGKRTMATLKNELNDLYFESLLLCDDQQYYKEELREFKVGNKRQQQLGRGSKKTKVTKLVGSIFWNEDFIDEDSGDVITIQRQRIVRVDGIWQTSIF